MYKYETHMHTSPVSRCANAGVRESLEFYNSLGYDGVFITNHFLDGNVNLDHSLPYKEKIEIYFSDYEAGVKIGSEIGIKVFFGVEMSYGGTDFLVYGLDKKWYLSHPQIMDMEKSKELPYLRKNGALVIQAHPFREDFYIDHVRLYPSCVDGVEVLNANRRDRENKMAMLYADEYGFCKIAGSDNHLGGKQVKLAGISTETPISDERDFISRVKDGRVMIFSAENK